MTVLVRFARRMATWEGERSAEELQQLEFKLKNGEPDLRPSVYLLADDNETITRAYAEHAATPPIKPDQANIGIDSTGCCENIDDTPGSRLFRFIREAHREFIIRDLSSLLEFVTELRNRVVQARTRPVTRAGVVAYARQRAAAADVEWVAVAELGKADWLKSLRKLIPKTKSASDQAAEPSLDTSTAEPVRDDESSE